MWAWLTWGGVDWLGWGCGCVWVYCGLDVIPLGVGPLCVGPGGGPAGLGGCLAGLGGESIDLLLLCEVLGIRLRAMSFRVLAKVGTAAL